MSVTVSQSLQAGHQYEHTLRFQTRAKATAAEMYSYINSNHFIFKYKGMIDVASKANHPKHMANFST
jgi:hypothetical protein